MSPEARHETTLSHDLQELGFSDYEARIYVALLQESPLTAYEISKRKGLPRANVYGALEGLERKQAVQAVSREPVRYVPVPPKDLLDRISRTVTDRCSRLRLQLEEERAMEHVQPVWNLRAAADARVRIDELVRDAKRHVWIKAHVRELQQHLDALRDAAKRGVQVLLVLFGTAEEMQELSVPGATVFPHEGEGTVVGLGRHLVTLTVDFEATLIFNMKEESGAYTHSTAVVNLADSLIRHEIYLAEIFGKLGSELEQHFGPALLALRKKYLPRDQAKALETRLKKAA